MAHELIINDEFRIRPEYVSAPPISPRSPGRRASAVEFAAQLLGGHLFSPASLSEDQLQAMWLACVEMAHEQDARQACQALSAHVSRIIAAPTLVFRREISPWKLIVRSQVDAELTSAAEPEIDELDAVSTSPELATTISSVDGAWRWTPVPLDEARPAQSLLLLPGDWRFGIAAKWLPGLAKTASLALHVAAARQTARQRQDLVQVTHAFARTLTRTTSDRGLHQVIVDTAAASVAARLASLAIYQPRDQAISIVATHGYSSEAVGHVRIEPGSGVIGGIFASKKPLLVRDTARVPGLRPRSRRYRTASFMAIPIVSGGESLGVLTLADQTDGRPFTREDLAAARLISTVASLALEKQHLARLADELSHSAAIDPLTGLFNRGYLETRLFAELERSRRTMVPVAVMMLDVDTFKGINDQLGHQTGDAVLRKVSEVIRRSLRASDVCTRYGGDEFSIIVAEHHSSAHQTAERVRRRVQAVRWDTLKVPQARYVTISIGIAISEPGEEADSLLRRADQNLYQAKALGRNRVYPQETSES